MEIARIPQLVGAVGQPTELHAAMRLWATVAALMLLYFITLPVILISGFWIWSITLTASFASNLGPSFRPEGARKECREKDTQAEQEPTTCHDNILYDMSDTDCMQICAERGGILIGWFEVHSNEVYEPVGYECTHCHRRHRRSSSALAASSSVRSLTPSVRTRLTAISLGGGSPVLTTPALLPGTRPWLSPSPSPAAPFLPLAIPKLPHPPAMPPLELLSLEEYQPQPLLLPQPEPQAHLLPPSFLSPSSPVPSSPSPPAPSSPSSPGPSTPMPSTSTVPSTSTSFKFPSASAFQTDATKLAVFIAAAVSPKSRPRKDNLLAACPTSGRNSSFGHQQQRRRSAPAATSSSTSSISSSIKSSPDPSSCPSPSLSTSSSLSGVSVVSTVAIASAFEKAGGKPSYMRGTAASQAKATPSGAREPSRLGCSAGKLSASSGTGAVHRGRALMGATYSRKSAQY